MSMYIDNKRAGLTCLLLFSLCALVLTGCMSPSAGYSSALDEGEKVNNNTPVTFEDNDVETNLFSKLPRDFVFSSGAGGCSTDIVIDEDGSFVGLYHDSDMGIIGEGYPNGTLYICRFSGKFSNPEPTDTENIYSMKLLELNIDNRDKIGTEEIVDDTLYVYTEPYGFDDADEFLVYVPGVSMSEIPEVCRLWTFLDESIFREVPEGLYIIYNVGGQEAFTAQTEDAIWNRHYAYKSGDAYAELKPSIYMGSYLDFFMEDDSPAALSLSVPWDGKNTEAMESKATWDNSGKMFNVTIESTGYFRFNVL